jgi:hypothetical protein
MAEFSFNNSISATTGVTPFFANYGYHPRYELDPLRKAGNPPSEVLKDYTDRLEKLADFLQCEIRFSLATQSEFADRHRVSPPDLRPGDYVWLLRRHIRTTRPSSKLDYKRLGRFQILSKVSSHAYKLDLPPSMKVHPVFHISLLEPCSSNPLPGQRLPQPEPTIVDDEVVWEVEEILDSKLNRGHLHYLVRWVGDFQDTWQPEDDLAGSPTLKREFHSRYPQKPRSRLL